MGQMKIWEVDELCKSAQSIFIAY